MFRITLPGDFPRLLNNTPVATTAKTQPPADPELFKPLLVAKDAISQGGSDPELMAQERGRSASGTMHGSAPVGGGKDSELGIAAEEREKEDKVAASSAALHRKNLIISGASYCLCSASLILLNKYALSSFAFACPTLLLFFHCLLAVLLVLSTAAMGYIEVEPLKKEIVYLWAPVNLLFVAMLVTSFFALQLLGVGMFTVLKNLTNFFTIGGDRLFFGKTYSYQVWACLFLMVVSAGLGGYTDLRFTLSGYSWQVLNCLITSSYSLYLSGVMSKVAAHTRTGQRMSEFSMVYYNNLLSLPLLLVLAAGMGEIQLLPSQPALRNPLFLNVAVLGGLIGFGISFSSLW